MPGVFRRRWFPKARVGRTSQVSLNASPNLVGVSATTHVGAFSEVINSTLHLTGVAATSQFGVFSDIINSNIDLIGQAATAAAGVPRITESIVITLTGVGATAGVGTSTEAVSKSLPLLGVSATTQGAGFAYYAAVPLIGVHATAQNAAFSNVGFPTERVFIIAGNTIGILPPGVAMYPTSDTRNYNTLSPYIIGSSQFYTIGQVSWSSIVRVQGTDWEFVEPFTHIIQILNPPASGTPIQLLYTKWNIGVTAGFEVTDYPIPFSFVNTTIIAEVIPPPNVYFTVNFITNRAIDNPFTVFALYPIIVDDIYTPYYTYDSPYGFETYRPAGFRVLDQTNMNIYVWSGTAWSVSDTLVGGNTFYSKRARAIFRVIGSAVIPVFEAGDNPNPTYPQALTYPAYGEGIGKNLIADAFSTNAATNYPAAYEVALSPGDYDPWVTG